MSDYNATVVAIDSGLDCFARIKDASRQYCKVVDYDLSQLGSSIAEKIRQIERRLDELYEEIQSMGEEEQNSNSARRMNAAYAEAEKLQPKLEQLEALQHRYHLVAQRYHSQSAAVMRTIESNTDSGIRSMAAYLQKIQDIEGIGGQGAGGDSFVNPFSGDTDYAVVIIDSAKYPETAEHIDVAVRSGVPAILTLDRPGANGNRNDSLRNVPVRHDFDRDEFPMAFFAEGGSGAHVFYLSASDNRGAGASVMHQLRNVPDGTRVRFRII